MSCTRKQHGRKMRRKNFRKKGQMEETMLLDDPTGKWKHERKEELCSTFHTNLKQTIEMKPQSRLHQTFTDLLP
jgi:hypothetical protein